MAPLTGIEIEAVVRQQAPAVVRDQVDRVDDELELRLAEEVVEVDAHPARLDALAAADDLALEFLAGLDVDAEQAMPVRTGAATAAARLDAEQVVEQRDDEVVVQVRLAMLHDEADDRQPPRRLVAEDRDRFVLRPGSDRALDEVDLALADRIGADVLLELEHESRADRLDDRRRAAFFAHDRIDDVAVLFLVDVRDRAAAGTRRHRVAQQLALDDEHARRLRAADELVRRDEHGVLVRAVALVDLDVAVRAGGGEVPEAERAVLVEELGDGGLNGRDAGDVGGGREAADLERPRGEAHELLLEVRESDVTIGILVDHDDIGDRLAPRQLVGVMLERADEHDRALGFGDAVRELVARVEIGRDAQLQDVDQLVDRAGRAAAGEDHQVIGAAADRALDHLTRVLAERRRLPAGAARLGVRVRVERHDLVADEVLVERDRAAARGVVRVRDAAQAVRAFECAVVADDRSSDRLDEALGLRVHAPRYHARRAASATASRRKRCAASRSMRGCQICETW